MSVESSNVQLYSIDKFHDAIEDRHHHLIYGTNSE